MSERIKQQAEQIKIEMTKGSWNDGVEVLAKLLRELESARAVADAAVAYADYDMSGGLQGHYDVSRALAEAVREYRARAESRCQYAFTEPEPPSSNGEPCALGHDNPSLRESPPLEARIAKACDKVLSDEDALAEMEAKQ